MVIPAMGRYSPRLPDAMNRVGKFDKNSLNKGFLNDTDYRLDDWNVHPYPDD